MKRKSVSHTQVRLNHVVHSPSPPSNCRCRNERRWKDNVRAALATSLAYPHIELDVCHWGPNWTVRVDFVERVNRAIQADAWVLDENYTAVRDIVGHVPPPLSGSTSAFP